jgi:hypothetical protein
VGDLDRWGHAEVNGIAKRDIALTVQDIDHQLTLADSAPQ